MSNLKSLAFMAAAATFLPSVLGTFNAAANSNMAVYWGQGPNQQRLSHFCADTNIDIIQIAFLNVFPDQSGGYPGTNFGNQCGSQTYKNPSGSSSPLLSNCPNIGPDIKTCQNLGKKVLLSLGGAIPDNQHVNSATTAVNFANFLWRAFGPDKESTTSTFPRPFGNAVVDGFDFDMENVLVSGENSGDLSRGYGTMISTLRSLYASDKSKSYYISGAPQCIVPDTHLANAIETSWFDFLFVQFYNTPSCSARAYFDHSYGGTNTNISFDKWISFVKASSFNKNVKVYMGLPASNSNQVVYDSKMYLAPSEANSIIKAFQCKYPSNFGGVMVFEATYSEMNSINGKPYVDVLKGYLKGTGCATKSKKMIKREAIVAEPDFPTALPTEGISGLAPSGLIVDPPSQTSVTGSASGTASACGSSTSAYASAVCATVGIFTGDSTPVGGSYNVASVEACEALCLQNDLCESISYNNDFGQLCDQYGNTVTQGGFEANPGGSPFYDRGCFDTGTAPSSCSVTQSTSSASQSSTATASITKSAGTASHSTGTSTAPLTTSTASSGYSSGIFPSGTAPLTKGTASSGYSSGIFPSGTAPLTTGTASSGYSSGIFPSGTAPLTTGTASSGYSSGGFPSGTSSGFMPSGSSGTYSMSNSSTVASTTTSGTAPVPSGPALPTSSGGSSPSISSGERSSPSSTSSEETISVTEVITLTSCAPGVTKCPARSYPVITTVVPITIATFPPQSGSPQTTEEVVVTDIVTSYVTTCPYTYTATSSGHEIIETGITTSTVFSTITSTICTKCVAPPTPAPTAQEATITEIVTSYTTTCPFSHTTTSAGSVIVSTGTTVSTVFSTITSTIFPVSTGSPSSENGSPVLPGALGHGAANVQPIPSILEAAQSAQVSAGSSPAESSPSSPENESPAQGAQVSAGSSPAGTSPSSPENESPAQGAQAPAGSSSAAGAETIVQTINIVPVETAVPTSVPASPAQNAQTGVPSQNAQSASQGNVPGQSGQSGSQPPVPGQVGQPGSVAPFPANNGTGSAIPSGTAIASASTSPATGTPSPNVATFKGAATKMGSGCFGLATFFVAAAFLLL